MTEIPCALVTKTYHKKQKSTGEKNSLHVSEDEKARAQKTTTTIDFN